MSHYTHERLIGLEYEFLAVQKENGQAATRDHIKAVWRDWAEAPHVELYEDPGTHQPVGVWYTQKDGQKVLINTDAGINVVEFGFLPFAALAECEENMRAILAEFLAVVARHNLILLSYGIQPKTPHFFPDLKTEKIWYRGFLRFEGLTARHSLFHNIAAHQPCIDVSYDELIPALNTLNALSGVVIALFANSGWGEGKAQCCHEEREHRWNLWDHGSGERVSFAGMPKKSFKDFRAYLVYNWSIPVRAVHRNKTLHSIWPAPDVQTYLRGDSWDTTDLGTGNPSQVTPAMEDANAFNQYVWIQARPKFFFDETVPLSELLAAYDAGGAAIDAFARDHLTKLYIETRNIACQPWNDVMAAPALLLGLIENISEAHALVKRHRWAYWVRLREIVREKSMETPGVLPLAEQILDIAHRGLEQRGRGEEAYLEPLLERVKRRESPAMRARAAGEKGGAEALIQETKITL